MKTLFEKLYTLNPTIFLYADRGFDIEAIDTEFFVILPAYTIENDEVKYLYKN